MSVNILGKSYPIETTTKLSLLRKGLHSIPKEIFSLVNLKELNLGFNSITNIPSEIKNLKKLEVLFLQGNELAMIPTEIYMLRKLKRGHFTPFRKLTNRGLTVSLDKEYKEMKKKRVMAEMKIQGFLSRYILPKYDYVNEICLCI